MSLFFFTTFEPQRALSHQPHLQLVYTKEDERRRALHSSQTTSETWTFVSLSSRIHLSVYPLFPPLSVLIVVSSEGASRSELNTAAASLNILTRQRRKASIRQTTRTIIIVVEKTTSATTPTFFRSTTCSKMCVLYRVFFLFFAYADAAPRLVPPPPPTHNSCLLRSVSPPLSI